MAASYKKLFKLLIDRDMKKEELAEKAGPRLAAIIKTGKEGAVVSGKVLVRIYSALDGTTDDIPKVVPHEKQTYGTKKSIEDDCVSQKQTK